MKNKKTNVPPTFKLEIGNQKNNLKKQLKQQNIAFDPSVIKKLDKFIKTIYQLRNEQIISKEREQKILSKIHQRAIDHIDFIYEML